MEQLVVPETEVLIATVIYLVKRGLTPYHFSVPRGKGIQTEKYRNILERSFKSLKFNPTFSTDGADIIAISDTEWWHIECKGSGTGKPQTQRNNFDRAISSVVSYFELDKSVLPTEYRNVEQFLGLALPSTPKYLHELKKRIRKPLREKLNLWILIYDIEDKEVYCIGPNQDY